MAFFERDAIISDIEEAADRMGLDLEDLQEMIVDVLDDALEKAEELQNAIASDDADQIKAIAHDIKGATANYGLNAPSAVALRLEKREGDLKADGELLVQQLKELLALKLDED